MSNTKLKKYAVIYHKTTIMVPYPRNPRIGICQACGRSKDKKEIKTTQLHHWFYKYDVKTVKKNPLLALENAVELCYRCHKIADAFRSLIIEIRPENYEWIAMVGKIMPEWMQKRFNQICQLWLKEIKK